MLAPVDVPLEDGEEPQAAPQDIQSAPVNSTAQVNLAPLSAPAALGEGGVPAPQPVAAPTATPTQVVAPLDLAEPESALPETVSSADASSVAAPQGQDASFDSPIEDANEVSAPNQANAPQVGASPSSGPIDVAAPSELTPSLPTPVTGGAEPITGAAPPIGWEGASEEEDVEAFGACENSYGGNCVHGNTPSNVDEKAHVDEKEVEEVTGSDKDDDPRPSEQSSRDKIKEDLPDVDEKTVNDFVDAVIEMSESAIGRSMTPAERVEALQAISAGITSGEITGAAVEAIAEVKAATPTSEPSTLDNRYVSGNIPQGPGISTLSEARQVGSGVPLAIGGVGATALAVEPSQIGKIVLAVALIGGAVYLASNSDDNSAPAITGSTASSATSPSDPNCPENLECDDDDIIELSDRKMYQQGKHYRKHGREMGFKSKKEYEAAAREFAKNSQRNSNSSIVEGTWNGSGQNFGATQRAISYDGKTVILDSNTGRLINFYRTDGIRGFTNLRVIR